ncbi:acyl-CoA dehydrogenase [Haematobacter massiliensis]|mgnify:CR=1 FL=1|uniref:acyl-CoA dehydrogenase family protein n=1 Tax=Haematobacter massiliensis TaxID=195105 RepID=UPI000B0AAE55|nr:acyl-CoA dehydrogenase family protein [Haematobacter massiliensis]OWJ69797.1 acyl-CoA dehydrogenase [Haematobacter massiliensis]OWJ86969.1 acyl-CoA dehydrogenase [Haematobacter massiliensis]QBJ25538.1 acyl-CoA dehydrogenase [Haematobacter massiliensis]
MLISAFPTPASPDATGDHADRAAALGDAFAPWAAEDDRAGAFPTRQFRRLAEERLLGLTAPTAFGGAGAGLGQAVAVIREIGRGDPSAALILAMHYINLATLPKGRWSPALLNTVLRAGARGALINAFRVEPDLGTPLRGGLPATIARRTPTGWSLSGRKIYSTGCEGLTWGLVWARTDEAEPRVGQFLLPLASPGVRIERTWDTLGLRASGSHDVVMEGVQLPLEHAADIRPPAEWGARSDEAAVWGTLLIGAIYTGVAEAARDWIAGFLKERAPANLGHPLADLPRVQEQTGAIAELIATSRRLIDSAARDSDSGSPPTAAEAGLVKHRATENAIAAVERALKLGGNHAIARRNPLERHLRDVLCGRIHSPQEDTILIAAGRITLDR